MLLEGLRYMKRCPKCGCREFIVRPHVVQTWRVDGNGAFVDAVTECDEVVHRPDNDDMWDCAVCGFRAPGRAFET